MIAAITRFMAGGCHAHLDYFRPGANAASSPLSRKPPRSCGSFASW